MASRAQSVVVSYVAWDTSANTPKSGDLANHTLRWVKDGTASAPTNSASEIDPTNAPGVYKLTLTGTETTCDVGTLCGKSSTANVVIIPITISFELLPTYAIGTNGSIATIDGTGRVSSDVTAINSSALSGNNATLRLKSLDIQNSTGTAVIAKSTGSNGYGIDVAGHGSAHGTRMVGGTNSSGDGGSGIYLSGGMGATNYTGGHGLSLSGGDVVSNGTGGSGLYAESGSGSSSGSGFKVYSDFGHAISIESPNGSGMYIQGREGVTMFGENIGLNIESVTGIGALAQSGVGYAVYVDGKTYGVGVSRPKKNVAITNFMFPMFDATTKKPKAGLTVNSERAIDGNAFAPCSGTAVGLGNGVYRINLSSSDMDGDKVMLRFTATDADDQLIEIFTQD